MCYGSPTEDYYWGNFGFNNWYDTYFRQGLSNDPNVDGYCGMPGQRNGLVATFSETVIPYIPYRQEVIVPFSIARKASACLVFTEVVLGIWADCELTSRSSQKYQYDSIVDPATNVQSIDYGTLVSNDGCLAIFSLTRGAASRKLDEALVENERI